MDPDDVVEAPLAALARDKLLCAPDWKTRHRSKSTTAIRTACRPNHHARVGDPLSGRDVAGVTLSGRSY